MNIIGPLGIGMFAGMMIAPEVLHTSPDRIEVTGAKYAYTMPESELTQGVEVLYGIGWAEGDEPIAFAIDPMTAYEVYAHDEANAERVTLTITPDRAAVIDHIIEQRIVWERAMNALVDGTHPAIDSPVDYFEIREGIIRVHARMEGTP
jgi:hypothetical protein